MILLQEIDIYLLILLGNIIIRTLQIFQLYKEISILDDMHEPFIWYFAARELKPFYDFTSWGLNKIIY